MIKARYSSGVKMIDHEGEELVDCYVPITHDCEFTVGDLVFDSGREPYPFTVTVECLHGVLTFDLPELDIRGRRVGQ